MAGCSLPQTCWPLPRAGLQKEASCSGPAAGPVDLVLLVADIDSPRAGLIRVEAANLISLAESLRAP